jgi:purine nucleoside permease
LNDLKESNEEAQYASDEKNRTDEEIGQATISKFTQVKSLNQKLADDALSNRIHFEGELRDTKTYLAWNEARQEEIARKSESLLENQCYSNQLFVRSLKQGQEAVDVIALLKQDLQGYIAAGSEFDLAQLKQTEVKTVVDKLRGYSNIIHASEVQAFLQLADSESSSSSSDSESSEEVHTLIIIS